MRLLDARVAAALLVIGLAVACAGMARRWHRLPRRAIFVLGAVQGAALVALLRATVTP